MEAHLLADIGKSIIAASILGIPAYFLKVPLILAYLLAGVVLGSNLGFGFIRSSESISTVSEIGLVLLMFILGLEIDIRKLMQAGKTVFTTGVLQFAGCAVLAYFFFSRFGISGYELTYLTMACALSSTLIVVKILCDQMSLDTLPSRITLGVLVIQDLWAISFLAVQPNLADLNAIALLYSLGKVAIMVFSSWLMAKYLLPKVFASAGKQPELMLILAMAWCFSLCGIAEYLKISLEMGALVAGVSIASFPYHADIAAKISSLRDFFLTLFFVGLGLQIPMPSSQILSLMALIMVFIFVSRFLTIFPVLYFMKYGNRVSLIPSVNLSQLSEFAVVLAALGVTYKHVSQDFLSAIILAMVFSALISSLLIPKAHSFFRFINPILAKIGFKDHLGTNDSDQIDHEVKPEIVVLGFYKEASSFLYELQSRYSEEMLKKFLIIDFNPEAHRKLKSLGLNCKYGDISNLDTLQHLHLEKYRVIISTLPDQVLKGITNNQLLKFLKKLAPEAKIITTADRIDQACDMYKNGAAYVSIPRITSARALVDVIERVNSNDLEAFVENEISSIKGRKEIII